MTSLSTPSTDRVHFHDISPAACQLLRDNKPLLLSLIAKALDAFYAHIARFPDARRFFRSSEHIEHAKHRQILHWGVILDAQFDSQYVASVTRIGEVHHNIGLEPKWYIGGYSFLLSSLIAGLARRRSKRWFGFGPARDTVALQEAVTRAVMLDMDYAIDVYLDAGRREREATQAQLAHFSEESSINVQTVAAASEELVAAISEISRQVAESASITSLAMEHAQGTSMRIQGLAGAADSIGEVVDIISNIASQTNLLALNATIEAARAGDHGRGFAVVATEVKSLASETAHATQTISKQISAIQASTAESVEAIAEISKTIGTLNGIASSIASAVDQQRGATQEISLNIQHVATGTVEVSRTIAGAGTKRPA